MEWQKSALEAGIDDNANESRKKLKSLTDQREGTLKRKLQLQPEAERKRNARKLEKEKVQALMARRPEIADELSCLTTSDKVGRPTYQNNESLLSVSLGVKISRQFIWSVNILVGKKFGHSAMFCGQSPYN